MVEEWWQKQFNEYILKHIIFDVNEINLDVSYNQFRFSDRSAKIKQSDAINMIDRFIEWIKKTSFLYIIQIYYSGYSIDFGVGVKEGTSHHTIHEYFEKYPVL